MGNAVPPLEDGDDDPWHALSREGPTTVPAETARQYLRNCLRS
jgi:hypothetical protein